MSSTHDRVHPRHPVAGHPDPGLTAVPGLNGLAFLLRGWVSPMPAAWLPGPAGNRAGRLAGPRPGGRDDPRPYRRPPGLRNRVRYLRGLFTSRCFTTTKGSDTDVFDH